MQRLAAVQQLSLPALCSAQLAAEVVQPALSGVLHAAQLLLQRLRLLGCFARALQPVLCAVQRALQRGHLALQLAALCSRRLQLGTQGLQLRGCFELAGLGVSAGICGSLQRMLQFGNARGVSLL